MSYLKFQLSQLTENDVSHEGENEFVLGRRTHWQRCSKRSGWRFSTDFHSFLESVNKHLQSTQYVPGAS